jgi:putative endonuclease
MTLFCHSLLKFLNRNFFEAGISWEKSQIAANGSYATFRQTRLERALYMVGWYVYIVRCADGSLYTGITKDVESRVSLHNAGRGAKYTRTRRPVELVYSEEVADRGAAMRRECVIKRLRPIAKRKLIHAHTILEDV